MTALRSALIAAAAVAVVLTIGGWFTPDQWFEDLVKPSRQPPGWVFGPVWSTLYVLIAVSFALALSAPRSAERRLAVLAMSTQLLLNAAWSPLFFGLHSPILAFVDIGLLWLVTLGSIAAVARVSGLGALLQLPVLLWISFALILNGVIMAMNG